MKFYLGPFLRDRRVPWARRSPPPGTLWTFDYSPPWECDSTAAESGMGLFALPDAADLPSPDYTLVVQGDWNSAPRESMRNIFGERIHRGGGRIAVSGSSIRDWYLDSICFKLDPMGDDAALPAVPAGNVMYQVPLAGGEMYYKSATVSGAEGVCLRRMMQQQYLRVLGDAEDGKVIRQNGRPDPQAHRRFLSVLGEKFRMNNPEDAFIPAGREKVTPMRHDTTVSDTFDRADGVLGANYSYHEGIEAYLGTVGNVARAIESGPFTGGLARYDADLSSSDNFAQFTLSHMLEFGLAAAAFRFQSGASTCYTWQPLVGFGVNVFEFYKWVGGVETGPLLTVTSMPNVGDVIYGEANGSTLTGKQNAVVLNTVLDTSIPTGTRGGFRLLVNDGSGHPGQSGINNFVFGDLAVAAVGNSSNLLLLRAG